MADNNLMTFRDAWSEFVIKHRIVNVEMTQVQDKDVE